ncbi:hypothetical protein Mal15_21910 [Stieleria maiorica]|uniref:Uncharacterized protein n=1 Tax=Stieleria maiorica TaxID=2795974 RepID=A0A5B9MBM1_9BACT|nr:hypothetical protein [Stieleria maiorica]QEF98143.1 hypothetical protein Mal15_21910 [Stieleria maiorica]
MGDCLSGSGCCCVDLTVTEGDNESKWERTDDSGVTTVTILVPIDICNFRFWFQGEQPEVNPTPAADFDFDGTATILFLESPSDDDADAIGTITFQNEAAWDYVGGSYPYDRKSGFTLPFWEPTWSLAWHSGEATINEGDPTAGTCEIDVDDWGFASIQTLNHSGSVFDGLRLESYDGVLLLGTDSSNSNTQIWPEAGVATQVWWKGGPAVTDVETLSGQPCVFARPGCTSRKVYVRYKTEGDFTATNTSFILQSVNDPGEETCRTESSYYDPTDEEGNCETPTDTCLVLPTRQSLFVKARLEITDWDGTGPTGGHDIDEVLWLKRPSTEERHKCWAEQLLKLHGEFEFAPGNYYGWWYVIFAELVCDDGVMVLEVSLRRAGQTMRDAIWHIELDYDVTHPSEIPTRVLNSSNALDTPENSSTVITIN